LKRLSTRVGIKARVEGREKAANSIYRKMRDQRKSFTDIMDVYAFQDHD
jgi:guanosine-3',5'-bis(diphosphate) 3'-pyrophosphohydrolase